jgi:hypothetical protein
MAKVQSQISDFVHKDHGGLHVPGPLLSCGQEREVGVLDPPTLRFCDKCKVYGRATRAYANSLYEHIGLPIVRYAQTYCSFGIEVCCQT